MPWPQPLASLVASRTDAQRQRQRLAWRCATGLVVALLLGTPVWAQYKWKDERGQVHLSDMPPPREVPERDILQRPRPRVAAALAAASAPASGATGVASATAAGGSASAPVDPELAKRRAAADAAQRQRSQAEQQRQAAQQAQNCQRARQQVALFDSGQRVQRLNAAGERVVLDDATRQAELQLARRVIASDCR